MHEIREVVGVCSDGAAMYSITALWTAAHGIPVTYVMLNKANYRILSYVHHLHPYGSRAAKTRIARQCRWWRE